MFELRITDYFSSLIVPEEQFEICIIIPAFNEANKLDIHAYQNFLGQHNDCFLVFCNDASTDGTQQLFEQLHSEFPEHSHLITNDTNKGKAETVRTGMLWAKDKEFSKRYAFLDADLATSLDECLEMSKTIKDEVVFSFGSRILTLDSHIERKAYRHYIGRVVATAISKILKLAVYDTQCGCKIFDPRIMNDCFEETFISRWLFDVELFFRIMERYGRDKIHRITHEYPLKQWIDKGESKVKFSYFFQLWVDLWRIKTRYRKV